MGEFFDLPTLFFLVVAIIVLLRLRSVLGTRDGFERSNRPKDDGVSQRQQTDNVVNLPGSEQAVPPAQLDEEKQRLKLEAEIERYAKSDASLTKGLNDIVEADASFSPKSFMDGAISAYEMVVVAFAEGDRKTLKMILDKSIYEDFEAAITDRESQKLTVQFTFVGFSDVKMKQAECDDKFANVTIEYNAQIVSATKDEHGNLVEGDEVAVQNIADEWTYQRAVKSRDPNWKLVSTNQID